MNEYLVPRTAHNNNVADFNAAVALLKESAVVKYVGLTADGAALLEAKDPLDPTLCAVTGAVLYRQAH